MPEKVRVVGLGSCTVDYFGLTPKIIGPEEKVNMRGLEVYAGGVTANNLTQVARLGVKTGWFGKLGDDENGRIIMEAFKEDDMDISHIKIIKGERSTFCWIPVDPQGNRCIYMFRNVTAKLTPEEIDEYFSDYIAQADAFHTEASQLPLPPVIRAIEIAKENNTRVVFDLDMDPTYFVEVAGLGTREELSRALELSDVLKPCKDAAAEITGETDLERAAVKLLDMGPELVALTAGERGCIIATKDKVVKVPTFEVTVVDTTGAGDAFQGGLSYAILQGWDLEQVGRFANACAALCCTKIGARAMFGLKEVNALIENGKILS